MRATVKGGKNMPRIDTVETVNNLPKNAILKVDGDYVKHSLGHHSQKDYLGFEIEVDQRRNLGTMLTERHANECVRILKDGGLMAHWTHDGSLNNGFELITHPATLDYIRAVEPTLTKLWRYLNAAGYNNDTGSAGGHIHVARRTLGKTIETQDANIDRLIKWVYRNRNEFIKFAMRESGYATYINYRDDSVKYVAVNTKHKKTIELRIFSGLTSLTNMKANAELVALVIRTLTSPYKRLEDYTLDSLIKDDYRSHRDAYNHWMSL